MITAALLARVAGRPLLLGTPGADATNIPPLVDALNAELGDTETTPPLRLAHLLAQMAEETEWFRFFVEIGGPTYFARYDGRADLGNTEPGDGYRYRGRSPLMITGRADYLLAERMTGLPLVENPDLAAQPAAGVKVSVAFWRARKVYLHADADDLEGVTRLINGGLNGLDSRAAALTRAKAALGISA